MRRQPRALPVVGVVLLLLAGCDSGKEMADLPALSDGLEATLPVVSGDLGGTCERQNRLVAEIPPEERSPTDKPQDCRAFQAAAERVAHDQSVLLAYFSAVGKLLSGSHAAFDAKLATNGTALSGYTGLPGAVVTASTAAQAILGKLTDMATHHYRRKEVAAIVRSADPAVQQLTKALREVVTTDYPVLLRSEQNLLANAYEGPIAARKGERLTLILVQRQYDTDRDALHGRQAAATAYGAVMTTLAELHGRLTTMATGGGPKQAEAAAVRASLATLKSDATQMAAAERR